MWERNLQRTIGNKEHKPVKKHRNKITKETKTWITNISNISNETIRFRSMDVI